MKNMDLIRNYWLRKKYVGSIIADGAFSDEELLFLTPNNVRRRCGFPAKRVHRRNRREWKRRKRKRIIVSSPIFWKKVWKLADEILLANCRRRFASFANVKDLVKFDADFHVQHQNPVEQAMNDSMKLRVESDHYMLEAN